MKTVNVVLTIDQYTLPDVINTVSSAYVANDLLVAVAKNMGEKLHESVVLAINELKKDGLSDKHAERFEERLEQDIDELTENLIECIDSMLELDDLEYAEQLLTEVEEQARTQ